MRDGKSFSFAHIGLLFGCVRLCFSCFHRRLLFWYIVTRGSVGFWMVMLGVMGSSEKKFQARYRWQWTPALQV